MLKRVVGCRCCPGDVVRSIIHDRRLGDVACGVTVQRSGIEEDTGIPVKFGHLDYTESHQVLLDLDEIKAKYGLNSMELMGLLEEQNIIVDAVGRFGTNEMTRRGCNESEMEKIAAFIQRILVEKDKTVKNEVIEFLKDKKISYSF